MSATVHVVENANAVIANVDIAIVKMKLKLNLKMNFTQICPA